MNAANEMNKGTRQSEFDPLAFIHFEVFICGIVVFLTEGCKGLTGMKVEILM